ncbi:hypothetical protein Tco_1144431 [Tanacetum coccineum]
MLVLNVVAVVLNRGDGGGFGGCGGVELREWRARVVPAKQDYGCKYFIWKDDLDLQLLEVLLQGFQYIQVLFRDLLNLHQQTECLNCKVKDLKIKMLEARLEMERNPEDHTCQSAAILHELLNEMENLRVE